MPLCRMLRRCAMMRYYVTRVIIMLRTRLLFDGDMRAAHV